MAAEKNDSETIKIGVLAGEPIRDAGLASIFDLPAAQGSSQLTPVIGALQDLLATAGIDYIVVDLHASAARLTEIESIRETRPDVRLIVIGPEGDDELVINSIIAGARAYLGLTASPEVVRKAIEIVTSGSIWAPRHLLSRLIDRLLKVPKVTSPLESASLTPREKQVLELILGAHSTREIACQLGIEQRTVKAYVARLMRKTGVDNRVKLTTSALGRALLAPEKAINRAVISNN